MAVRRIRRRLAMLIDDSGIGTRRKEEMDDRKRARARGVVQARGAELVDGIHRRATPD
jgi:hypothetical protein